MIVQKPSPNFTPGRAGQKPVLIVIHIMAGTLKGTDAWFANPASDVSSHYGVGTNGEVHQYVKESDTAWANGRVNYPTSKIVKEKGGNPNIYSISIENEGYDLSKASKTHLETLKALIADVCTRNDIPNDREHIIGHYEIYSLKPNCPATDKSIIDSLITNDNTMELTKDQKKDLAKLGFDFGDNLNSGELDRLIKKALDLQNAPTPPSENCDVYKQEIEDLKAQSLADNARIKELEPKADIGNRFTEVSKMANSL